MLDYDIQLYTEMALNLLEGDIQFWCRRYSVPGYDFEDLCQEVRFKLWRELPKYDPTTYQLRTFARNIIKNQLRHLLRDNTRQKRWNGEHLAEIPENYSDQTMDLAVIIDFCIENNKKMEDFF